MRASTPIILTIIVIGGGRISQGYDPVFTERMVVGGMFLIMGIAVANQFSTRVAFMFALLIFISAFFIYGLDLMRAIGFQVGSNNTGNI